MKPPRPPRVPPRRRRGVALLFVFSAVALLSTVASGLHQSSLFDWRVARREADRVRAEAVARSGLALAEELLITDQRAYFWYPDGDTPAVDPRTGAEIVLSELEEGYQELSRPREMDGLPLVVRIEDESAYVNLNRSTGGHLRRLLTVLGQILPLDKDPDAERREDLRASSDATRQADLIEELVAAFEDWRDTDEVPRPKGAERQEYDEGGGDAPRFRPRNGPLLDPRELRMVKGYSDAILDGMSELQDDETRIERPGLLSLVSLHGTLARVNANSAALPILEATPGIYESPQRIALAEAIAANRPYRNRQQLQQVMQEIDRVAAPQALPWLDIRSEYFRIHSSVQVPGSGRVTIECVVRRLPGNRIQRVSYREL